MIVKVRKDANIKRTAGWISYVLRQSDEPVIVRFSCYAAVTALRVICLAQRHVGVDVPITITDERDENGGIVYVARMDGVALRNNMRSVPGGINEKRAVFG